MAHVRLIARPRRVLRRYAWRYSLAAWIALENYRSRFNAALGLRSEGFTDRCELRPVT